MVLMTTPNPATAITTPPGTEAGAPKRRTASQLIPPIATSRRMALNKAAMMVERRQPYVRRSLGAIFARWLASQARSKLKTSLKLWPASARSASELMRHP